MTCEQCRSTLSAGDASATAQRHLGDCAACRRWAAALARVRAEAPALVGSPPEGLADRVLARVAPAAAVAPAVTGPFRRARPAAPRPWAAPAVAAVAAVVVGVLALAQLADPTSPPEDAPGDQVLAAAATALRGSGGESFRFDVEGELTANFVLPEPVTPPELPELPPPAELPELPAFPELPGWPQDGTAPAGPDCAELPDEFAAPCEAYPGDGGAAAWYREQLESWRATAEQTHREQLAQTREQFEQHLAELREELARVSGEAVELTSGPQQVRVAFTGEGAADGAGAARATVDHRIEGPVTTTGTLEVVTVDGVTHVHSDTTGGWVRLDAPYQGFRFGDLAAPQDLHALLDLVEEHDGPVADLGERDRDGVRQRGLRIQHARGELTAWVGIDDGLLRELTHEQSLGDPDGTHVSARTTLRFRDFGAPVDINPPADATPVAQLPPGRLPPFHLGIELDLDLSVPAQP